MFYLRLFAFATAFSGVLFALMLLIGRLYEVLTVRFQNKERDGE